MILIILAGGYGTRLWPLSNKDKPKQFLRLQNNYSMFQETLSMCTTFPNVKALYIATQDKFFVNIYNDLEDLKENITSLQKIEKHIYIESDTYGTALSITNVLLDISNRYGQDEIILTIPVDQIIYNQKNFNSYLKEAVKIAQMNKIVTFGINPLYPSTDYGYIKYVGKKVIRFIEKPPKTHAECYFKSENFLWNAGIFCFKTHIMINNAQKYAKNILETAKKIYTTKKELNISEFSVIKFENIKIIIGDHNYQSIDREILEKTDNVYVITCKDIEWHDLGSWNAIEQNTKTDKDKNKIDGYNIFAINSSNCYIKGSENKYIYAVGVDNLSIIDTQNAILITNRQATNTIEKYKLYTLDKNLRSIS